MVLIYLKKFSSFHNSNHIYVNSIIFPDDFKNELAKDLIKSVSFILINSDN